MGSLWPKVGSPLSKGRDAHLGALGRSQPSSLPSLRVGHHSLPGDASKSPDVLRQASPALHQARGAPGPRSQASHAAGTRAIRGGRSSSSAPIPFHPTGFSTVRACLFTKPPRSRPVCRHRASPKTQARRHAYAHSLRQLQHFSSYDGASANSTWRSAPNTSSRRGGLASTDVYSHSPPDPAAWAHLVQPTPVHASPATRASRPDEATLRLVECRRGRPRRPGAPCCGWPSCAQGVGEQYGFPRRSTWRAAPRLPRLQQLLLGRGPAGAPRLRPARP